MILWLTCIEQDFGAQSKQACTASANILEKSFLYFFRTFSRFMRTKAIFDTFDELIPASRAIEHFEWKPLTQMD